MEAVSALKVGCGKFFHGEGVISLLAGEIMRLGGKALLVGGPTSVDRVMDAARESLDAAGVSCVVRRHTDYCTVAWAETYAALARSEGCTVLVGVGGGKCIDEVKCAAHFAGLPIITVPTSIATCVATSMVCIMYNEKGQRAPAVNLSKEVDRRHRPHRLRPPPHAGRRDSGLHGQDARMLPSKEDRELSGLHAGGVHPGRQQPGHF